MKIKLENKRIELWLEQRTPRERIFIFGVGFFMIYLMWNLLFETSLHKTLDNLKKQNQELTKLRDKQREILASIEQTIASSAFEKNLEKHRQLTGQFKYAGKQLQSIEQTIIPEDRLSQLTNDIIEQQREVTLISLKTFSEEPWIKENTLELMQPVGKHRMELEFRGTYFNNIAFLAHLEKLPWHLYWDQLEYQVLNYPEARVVARFYVLSQAKE